MVAPDEANQPTGIDFRDRDLRGQDFSGQDLRNADFAGADLRNCKFQNTDLTGSNFRGAIFGIDYQQGYRISITGCCLFAKILLLLVGRGFLEVGGGLLFLLVSPLIFFGFDLEKAINKTTHVLDFSPQEQAILALFEYSNASSFFILSITSFIAAGAGYYFLVSRTINQDSLGVIYGWNFGFLIIGFGLMNLGVYCIMQAIKTDFANAILQDVYIDRTSFNKAKSVGVEVDRINWQD